LKVALVFDKHAMLIGFEVFFFFDFFYSCFSKFRWRNVLPSA
jgi:hypothetical protein